MMSEREKIQAVRQLLDKYAQHDCVPWEELEKAINDEE